MGQELKISSRYEPLFEWFSAEEFIENSELKDPLWAVDTVVITGGRLSQKSFAVGTATCVGAKDFGHSVLYSRYTLTSAEDSIIPEFKEKIDLLYCAHAFDIKRDRVEAIDNNAKIVFKGIKTSSGNQTASLKSLKGFSVFVLEEAEEMPNFEDWDKIRKSIRAGKRNLNILILNPTTKEHWVYREFFEDRGVNEGFNGIVDNVLYIHTSYLDMPREFIPDAIWSDFEAKRIAYEKIRSLYEDDINKLSQTDPKTVKDGKYYKHIVLGGWLDKADGVILTNWRVGKFQEVATSIYGQDFGFSIDPTTLVRTSIDKANNRLYVKLLMYKPKMTTDDIYKENYAYADNSLIYADSAEPRLITELKNRKLNIKETVKGQGSITAGIAVLQNFDEIIVDPESIDLIKELNNYVWHDKKSKTPIDAYNHAIDAIRYAVYPQYAKKKGFVV